MVTAVVLHSVSQSGLVGFLLVRFGFCVFGWNGAECVLGLLLALCPAAHSFAVPTGAHVFFPFSACHGAPVSLLTLVLCAAASGEQLLWMLPLNWIVCVCCLIYVFKLLPILHILSDLGACFPYRFRTGCIAFVHLCWLHSIRTKWGWTHEFMCFCSMC